MKQAISNKNVTNARFDVAEFSGEWRQSFGCPELRGSWLVFGSSGSGKTTFALQLAKYLAQFKKVAYNSLEQGLSYSFQRAWERVGMQDAGNKIILLEKEAIDDLRLRLSRRKSPDIVIIDSLTCLPGFRKQDYVFLMRNFTNKLFVFIAHEKNHMPDPSIAETVRRLSDVKIYVEGYKAFVTSRYTDVAEDFVIWPEGAEKYWSANI
jgi:Predicted ATP-dependent serine protease